MLRITDMKGSQKFLAGLVLTTVLNVMDVFLLMNGLIDITLFSVIMLISMILLILPTTFMGGTNVKFEERSIHITAPFVDQEIPYTSVTSFTSVRSLDRGTRVFGYGGLRYGSGDFTNDSLGPYVRAMDSRIPLVIIIKTGKRTVAFNMGTVEDTTTILEELESKIPDVRIETLLPPTPEDKVVFRRKRRTMAAICVVAIAVILMFVAWMMTIGNISATLDDDSLSIDATLMHEDVDYGDITYVEIRTDMDYGDRIGGLGNSKVLTGNFRNDEFGKYRLAVWKDVNGCIVVHTTGKTVVFNLGSMDATRAIYEDLMERIDDASMVSIQKPDLYHLHTTI